jgi:NAD(P)-dependent dehydrogenase (short-subunit alcohol dehydrogenase family)
MSCKVLVTGAFSSAGRSMIEALGADSVTLLACDCKIDADAIDAPPSEHCFRVHRSDDPEFVGDLVTLCVLHDVDVVVPTRAADQLALARVRKLFEELGARVWLAPIPEHATRSQARRILQLGERGRSKGPMSEWLRRWSQRGQDATTPPS